MRISLIAAVSPNGIIGHNNAMPWNIPEDLRLFKETTLHHPVIMGRKTYQSLGRPLPKRRNMVVSRSWGDTPEEKDAGIEIFSSLEAALRAAARPYPENGEIKNDEAFIIGGAQIYAQGISLAHRLYISRLHKDYQGDTSFPPILSKDWTLTSSKPYGEFNLEIYDRTGA